ncbi:MAG: TetR/AcrR family transcriptional regulator [Gammaproteobacteria bacterium]|nr:TetR/AcrR family transcriptional regulator [Gammaproteobacteria bacterium]
MATCSNSWAGPAVGNRERILEFSLAAFNRQGFDQVSTLTITSELAISPGNLYYHFANRDEIARALMQECELALQRLSQQFEQEVVSGEDYWPYLHSLLTLLDQYRFVLRDLAGPALGHSAIRRPLTKLLSQLRQLGQRALQRLQELGWLQLEQTQRELLAENILMVTIGWLQLHSLAHPEPLPPATIRAGVKQLLALVQPYLTASG